MRLAPLSGNDNDLLCSDAQESWLKQERAAFNSEIELHFHYFATICMHIHTNTQYAPDWQTIKQLAM